MLYSRNRYASSSASVPSVELESFDQLDNMSTVMETVMQIHENDLSMFDALIECDFREVEIKEGHSYNEATAILAEADEAKKQNIFQKIKALVQTAITKIGELFTTIINKIKDLVNKDKRLIKKYGELYKKADFSKFEGFENAIDLSKVETALIELGKKIYGLNQDAMNKSGKTDDELKNIFEEESKKIEEATKTVDKYIPDSSTRDIIYNLVNTGVSGGKTKSETVYADAKDILDKALQKAKPEGDNNSDSASELYKQISNLCQTTLKLSKLWCDTNVKKYSLARKYFIGLARFAKKGSSSETSEAKGEDKKDEKLEAEKEAVLMSLLAEDSDAYVERFVYGY